MPLWLIKLFHSLGRKQAAKRTGIAQIPTPIEAEGHGAALYTQLREAGFKDADLAKLIKSEKDIIRLVNKVESMQNQKLKSIERKFFDPSGKMKPEGQDIVKKGLEGLGKKKDPFQGFTPKIVPKETDAQIKARMIKENRRNVQKSYLRQLDEKKILKVEEGFLTKADLDNMSPDALDSLRRNVDPHGMHKHFGSEEIGKIDDFASGGRIGFAAGGAIIKELVKRIYAVKAGTGIYKGLSETNKTQLIKKFISELEAAPGGKKYLDNLWTKKIKKLEKEDRLKEIEQKSAAQSLAIKNYPEGPSTLPWSKEQEMHWKRLMGEDIKEELVDTDYIIDQADELLRKKASGGIARVGYLKGKLVKGILSLGKKKKPKINRKLTKDELDDLYEEFDEAVPYPMETVRDKEKFLKAVKDEEAYMFQQYKKGNLDPKPGEPGRKQFLEKKLEEMELSGDKRLMTIDEIEELSSFDLGTEMDEAIKKYKQKDIQQKRELQTFDVTGRKKNASGGIAGELHLNEGGRVSFTKGGKVSSGLAKILGV